jgi:hypothetical protein
MKLFRWTIKVELQQQLKYISDELRNRHGGMAGMLDCGV